MSKAAVSIHSFHLIYCKRHTCFILLRTLTCERVFFLNFIDNKADLQMKPTLMVSRATSMTAHCRGDRLFASPAM